MGGWGGSSSIPSLLSVRAGFNIRGQRNVSVRYNECWVQAPVGYCGSGNIINVADG